MPDGKDVSDILNDKGFTLREYQLYNPSHPFGVPLAASSTRTNDVVESEDIWTYEDSEADDSCQEETEDEDIYGEENDAGEARDSYQEETEDEDIYGEENDEQATDKKIKIEEMENSEIQAKVEDEAVEDAKNTHNCYLLVQKDGRHVEVDINMDTVESRNQESKNQMEDEEVEDGWVLT